MYLPCFPVGARDSLGISAARHRPWFKQTLPHASVSLQVAWNPVTRARGHRVLAALGELIQHLRHPFAEAAGGAIELECRPPSPTCRSHWPAVMTRLLRDSPGTQL